MIVANSNRHSGREPQSGFDFLSLIFLSDLFADVALPGIGIGVRRNQTTNLCLFVDARA